MDRRLLVVALTCLVVAMTPAAAWAQKKGGKGGMKGGNQNGKQQGPSNLNEVTIDGVIKQVSSQGLVVSDNSGARLLVGFNSASMVSVEGTATAEFLTRGAFLEMEVTIDRAGTASEPVAKLTFIEPSNVNPAGLFPTFVPDAETERASTTPHSYLARGTMQPPRNGMLVLQTGSKVIQAKVSNETVLQAKLGDWRLAVVGDRVRGKGESLPLPNQGLTPVVATQMTIEAAQPIRPWNAKRTEAKAKPTKEPTGKEPSAPVPSSPEPSAPEPTAAELGDPPLKVSPASRAEPNSNPLLPGEPSQTSHSRFGTPASYVGQAATFGHHNSWLATSRTTYVCAVR